MDINERVKIIRKELKMTMEEFGSHLGVTKVAISMIESGKRGLTDQMFLSIVREFGVNPEWLKDGTGDPFKEVTRNKRIEGFVKDILTNEPEGRKARLIDALASLDGDGWDTLYNIASRFVERQNKEVAADQADQADTTAADADVPDTDDGDMTAAGQPEESPNIFTRQDDTLLPFA